MEEKYIMHLIILSYIGINLSSGQSSGYRETCVVLVIHRSVHAEKNCIQSGLNSIMPFVCPPSPSGHKVIMSTVSVTQVTQALLTESLRKGGSNHRYAQQIQNNKVINGCVLHLKEEKNGPRSSHLHFSPSLAEFQ